MSDFEHVLGSDLCEIAGGDPKTIPNVNLGDLPMEFQVESQKQTNPTTPVL